MTESSKKGWYVLRAISGKEAKVKEILDATCQNTDLGNYVFQVVIPTEKVLQVRGGKKVVKERNLYGGYVFVEAILTGEVINTLQNTSNVIDFLRQREVPHAPERLRDADAMRMLGVADEFSDPTEDGVNDYIVGETVKVNEGPFNGFSAVVEEVYPDKKKLKVSVKIFGRKTPMELDNSQVERE
ncbi:MAG: transcription termination/antitermination protein NusG [Muribaculaceae bacterium]|nr:transcription termination/antitermination protein NusG [Muribaculaceae bacterium]